MHSSCQTRTFDPDITHQQIEWVLGKACVRCFLMILSVKQLSIAALPSSLLVRKIRQEAPRSPLTKCGQTSRQIGTMLNRRSKLRLAQSVYPEHPECPSWFGGAVHSYAHSYARTVAMPSIHNWYQLIADKKICPGRRMETLRDLTSIRWSSPLHAWLMKGKSTWTRRRQQIVRACRLSHVVWTLFGRWACNSGTEFLSLRYPRDQTDSKGMRRFRNFLYHQI